MGRRPLTRAACLAAALGGGCAPEARPPQWRPAFETPLDTALLGVWSEDSVRDGGELWVVGAADGAGPLAMRFVDGAWSRLPVSGNEDLWWVAPHPDGRRVMVGAGPRALSWRDGAVAEVPIDGAPPAGGTLYGVWFASTGAGWAVGGDPGAAGPQGPRGLLLRFVDDPTPHFEPDPLAPATVAEHLLFKVWGRSADDVWVVGEAGFALHWDGAAWEDASLPTLARMTTVHGDAEGPVAVGGTASPQLWTRRDGAWVDRSDELPVGAQGLNGVFLGDTELVTVGNGGLVARGALPVQALDADFLGPEGLHAVSIDAAGEVWAVGGDLLRLEAGQLWHFGPAPLGGLGTPP